VSSVYLEFLSGGYLWAVTYAGGARVIELDPRTLAVVRDIKVTPDWEDFDGLSQGAGGSVWTGSGRVLVRLDARTGTVLDRMTLPAGQSTGAVAFSPDGTIMYGSTGISGGGGIVREYSMATGRVLAVTSESPASILASFTSGPAMVAMPGRLWVYSRTGMMGASALLSQARLAVLRQPRPETFDGPYEWGEGADAVYQDGVLWWADSSGYLACIDPATGTVRASDTLTSPISQILAVTSRVYVVVNAGVAAITPPAACR
jgi:outer membrane protein assembly factor BamB